MPRQQTTTRTAPSPRCAASTTARLPTSPRRSTSRPASRSSWPSGSDEPAVLLYGIIDRIDRHDDGTIEIIDYKTGKPKNQKDVDEDEQLSAYALAMSMGAVVDPNTKKRLPAATKLTLYFTETDQAMSTTRTPEQLDAFRLTVLEKAHRIRSGDFTASPDVWRCGRCDYRLICPSRYGTDRAI